MGTEDSFITMQSAIVRNQEGEKVVIQKPYFAEDKSVIYRCESAFKSFVSSNGFKLDKYVGETRRIMVDEVIGSSAGKTPWWITFVDSTNKREKDVILFSTERDIATDVDVIKNWSFLNGVELWVLHSFKL